METVLRVNIDDPELVDIIGFDGNGDMIFAYKGMPFTGIEEGYYSNNPQQLQTETEYQEGYMAGLMRSYYSNGQLEEEYYKGRGGFNGTYKNWDENEKLTYSSMWIAGYKVTFGEYPKVSGVLFPYPKIWF